MAKFVAPGPLKIKDENFSFHPKKAVLNAKLKNSKTDGKKGGTGRKALNDITNKKSLQPEASLRQKKLPKEEINIMEETFSHDHRKCIEEQKAAMRNFSLETVLPKDDSLPILEQIKVHRSPQYYPEPVELSMSEFSDLMDYSIRWSSPPLSPLSCDSPPSSFAWQDEAVEFVLLEDNKDAQVQPTIFSVV